MVKKLSLIEQIEQRSKEHFEKVIKPQLEAIHRDNDITIKRVGQRIIEVIIGNQRFLPIGA